MKEFERESFCAYMTEEGKYCGNHPPKPDESVSVNLNKKNQSHYLSHTPHKCLLSVMSYSKSCTSLVFSIIISCYPILNHVWNYFRVVFLGRGKYLEKKEVLPHKLL